MNFGIVPYVHRKFFLKKECVNRSGHGLSETKFVQFFFKGKAVGGVFWKGSGFGFNDKGGFFLECDQGRTNDARVLVDNRNLIGVAVPVVVWTLLACRP